MKSHFWQPEKFWFRYAAAILAVTVATFFRLSLSPVLGQEFPFHAYWLAVALIGYWLGSGPGLITTILGILAAKFFFIVPLYSFAAPDKYFVFRSAVYLLYCLGIIAVTGALRGARANANLARIRAQEAEARANRILNSINDGFAVFDPDWRCIHLNPRAEELIGHGQLLGNFIWQLHPEMAGSALYNAMHAAQGGPRQVHFEYHYVPFNLWLEGDVYPADPGVTLFFRDITDRKRAELELAEQTRELERKSEQLQRSNAELEQFAYAAAHDLQEPLRAIGNMAQLLGRNSTVQSDPQGRESIGQISRGVNRMSELIHDLLTYSWTLSKADRDVSTVDMKVLVEMAVMNCASAVEDSEAIIDLGEMPQLVGNALHLVQVFQNLISNAIKYRAQEQPHIRINCQRQDDCWLFSVCDNGIGIDMQYSDRIFGVFKRLHGPEIPGTGIGLAICKRIVENHGGRIWVESQPRQGSRFHFTLPA